MLFLLSTPEYTNAQSNTTKVKVHLRNGVAEVFNLHQDLMGELTMILLKLKQISKIELKNLYLLFKTPYLLFQVKV
jgi:hypothetical protein